ncbi:maestro heat-like repeat-containing protein family member 7 [Theristicus caerulescens]
MSVPSGQRLYIPVTVYGTTGTTGQAASGSPHRSRAPGPAEDERAGVAAEDRQRSESPRQCEDLGSANPVTQAEEDKSPVTEAEEDKSPVTQAEEDKSPVTQVEEDKSPVTEAEEDKSPGSPAMSAAATASSCQLQGEKEAHDYFLAFLNSTKREEASKLRFLASICTLCRAWLQGRFLPGFRSACELVEKMKVRQQKEPQHRTDAAMWQQAVLAVVAMSGTGEGGDACTHPFPTSYGEEREGLLYQYLDPCINTIFCLAPAQKMDSQPASLRAQVLMPFTASQELARRRSAVGRIVSLTRFLRPPEMLAALHPGEGNPFLFSEKPLPFLGEVMGYLTLSCAEQDEEISRGALEALRAFHTFILLRRGHQAAWEDPKLQVERECISTFSPKEPADETMIFGSFLLPTERNDLICTVLRGMVHLRVSDTQTVANVLEAVLRDPGSELKTVYDVVQTIHEQLPYVWQTPLRDILRRTLLQVAQLYPQNVTMGLLKVSGPCDSTASAMWSMLASKPCQMDCVLKALLLVQQAATGQNSFMGECRCYRFLALASAMHRIFLTPASRCCVQLLFEELFMAVVFQISFGLKGLQQRCSSHAPVCSLRSAVSAMQALFHCLGSASLVEDIRRQGAWDMLRSSETYHTGIALLTRVVWREVPHCCTAMADQAVVALLQRQAYQHVGAMAVFIELLDSTDFEHGPVLRLLQSHLQSESLVLRRMAVTSLVTLSGRPKRAATLQDLLPEVMQRLQDDDCDVKMAALAVLGNMLCLVDRQRAVPIALQLVKTLPPLFENESTYVRERSILLCRDAMQVAVSTHKEQMRKDVQKSLVPLFFHLHDEDHSVAQASRQALLGAAKLLKWRQLRKLLETEQTWRVGECLLVEDSRRVEAYLQQSLLYLQSVQEPLREAAVRFIGLARQELRDVHQEKFQLFYKALQDKVNDSSLLVSSLAAQTLLILGTAVKEPPSGFRLQALCYWLRRAWRRRNAALGDSWLCCWSCAQS